MTRVDMVGCTSCANSYQGADLALRCRVNGLLASSANAEGCRNYRYEPVTNAEEIEVTLLCVRND
jgi:hypothetical protein